MTWEQLVELQNQIDDLTRQKKTTHEIESILQEFLQKECLRRELKIKKLSMDEKREIVSDKAPELCDAAQNLQSMIDSLLQEIKVGVDNLDLTTIPRNQITPVGSWWGWNYSTQPDKNGYAFQRAKAEALKWEALGFEATVRTEPGERTFHKPWACPDNRYFCDVKINGPVNLIQRIPIYHFTVDEWLQLIYQQLPACNVKVLFHNSSLPNRWD